MPEQSSAPVSGDSSVQNIPVPPSPQAVKSSNEILTELFGAFNATPPPLDDITPQDSLSAVSEKSSKKHKKHNKKKHKKEKKRKRSSSSESRSSSISKKKFRKTRKRVSKRSNSETESVDSKKKKKKKLGKFSASDTDSDEEEPKKKKIKQEKSKSSQNNRIKIKEEKRDDDGSKAAGSGVSTVPISIQESILKHTVSRIVEKVIDSTRLASEDSKQNITITESENTTLENLGSDRLQTLPAPIKQEPKSDSHKDREEGRVNESAASLDLVGSNCGDAKSLPVADVFAEDLIDSGIKKDYLKNVTEKPKSAPGKITIKNLKFSQVYEATVKQIEEEAKLKAEKYEEGELSESSAELGRSPSPESELSSTGSVDEVELELEKRLEQKEKKHRHHHRKEKHRHRDRRRSTSKDRHRSRVHRDQSGTRHNHKERSRRQSRERTEDRVRSKESNRSRERHRSRERAKSKERARSRERERSKDRDKSKERERNERHRSARRLRSRDKRNPEEKIDKQKLLEIARKNAMSMMKNSAGGALEQTKVAITAGGKTVNELTDFCKLLSKKDADGHESISPNTSQSDDSESEKPFHHPFQIKDRPSGIVMNIRNSVALPVKSHQEKTAEQSRQLRLQFPVSSGQHHRKTESEWVPVSPKKTEASTTATNTQVAIVRSKRTFKDHPDPPAQEVDIGSIVSARLSAMRRLQENPTDPEALTQIYRAQQSMQSWAESKQNPHDGQFTGSTGVKVLSQAELASGYQAWARRDQLQCAAPVNSGMGMTLLQKMGWRPGEGLGKNKEGTLQPLLLEVKMDKKGLVAQEELPVRQPHQVVRGPPRSHSLEGKHPVSLLNEYCSRRKYGPPLFDLVDEAGPDHKKNFLFKVRVNGVEYKPTVGSPKKKQARAEAAEVCLKALGVLSNR